MFAEEEGLTHDEGCLTGKPPAQSGEESAGPVLEENQPERELGGMKIRGGHVGNTYNILKYFQL